MACQHGPQWITFFPHGAASVRVGKRRLPFQSRILPDRQLEEFGRLLEPLKPHRLGRPFGQDTSRR